MAFGQPTVLIVITLAGMLTGCADLSNRAPGCVSPPYEAALLDELAKDPALAVSPADAKRRDEPRRQVACRKVGKDVSRTSVTVEYDVSRDLDIADVRATFDPVASGAGWISMSGRQNDSNGSLLYCRNVLDQPSLLSIHWQDAITIDSDGENRRVPGALIVTASGSADGGLANVESDRRAAGCAA